MNLPSQDSVIPNTLENITLDKHTLERLYLHTLNRLNADPNPANRFNNLIARGNIFLLADRPYLAMDSFRQAALVSEGDLQQLTAALEGIVKSIRAQAGSHAAACDFLHTLRRDPAAVPQIRPLLENIPPSDLQQAAQSISLPPIQPPNLPRSALIFPSPFSTALPSDLLARAPPPSEIRTLALAAEDPLLLARLCPQLDPDLRSFQDRWQIVGRNGDTEHSGTYQEIVLNNEYALLFRCSGYNAGKSSPDRAFIQIARTAKDIRKWRNVICYETRYGEFLNAMIPDGTEDGTFVIELAQRGAIDTVIRQEKVGE